MKGLKKNFCFLLVAVMIIACAACGGTGDGDDVHTHTWADGVCSTCNEECEHEEWASGVCSVCSYECNHVGAWFAKTGTCLICGEECDHNWNTSGVCTVCSYVCAHTAHDSVTEICNECNILVGHWYEGSLGQTKNCSRCDSTTKYEVDMPDYVKTDVADATKRGTFEYIEYTVYSWKDGVEDKSKAYTKHAYVYLPYNYVASEQYDIIYFLHGGGGTAEDYFFVENSNAKEILNNMIAANEMKPTLVVTPDYAKQTEIPHAAKANEAIANKSEYPDGVPATRENSDLELDFGTELREYLMPAVEAKYASYADADNNGEITYEELMASREHRAICGYSAGSGQTINSGLIANTDLFAYYGSFASGGDYEKVLNAIQNSESKKISYYYLGVGGADGAMNSMKPYYDNLIKNGGTYITTENSTYLVKTDHAHTTVAILIDLYNCLKNEFFKH